MKAYEVYNCRITGGKSWSGVVVDITEVGVSEAIKKKFGLDSLYCEERPDKMLENLNRRQYDYKEIPIESVWLSDLTVGELMGMLDLRRR